LRAGADALCLGAEVDAGLVERVHAGIVAAVHSGRLAEERLEEAAGRVAKAARLMSRATDVAPDAEVGLEAARRALRAEGDVASDGPPLVVELRPAASIAAGEAGRGLGTAVRSRAPGTAVVRLAAAPEDAGAVLRRYEGRPLVVVVRDAHRYEWQRAAVDALLAAGGGGTVVETGLAVWRPERASAYVATYGAGRVNLEAAAELIAPCGSSSSV
jgi:beta-N-acetylhexosaminidase